MKLFLRFLLIVTYLFATLSAQDIKPDKRGFLVQVGDEAPNFEMVFTNGKTSRLLDYRGNPVMLQFTASWCSVCRKEMPHIESEIWQVFKDKGLIVVGIDRDEPKEIVLKFAKEMKITYPLTLDPGAEIFGLFADKKSGVTRNVIIDHEGTIVFLTRLFNRKEFDSMIKKIIELTSIDKSN